MSDRIPGGTAAAFTAAETIIPLAEERLEIGKRTVETGRVRVTTMVETREEIARADLLHDDVSVEHIPIGRRVDSLPPVREENGVIIVSVVEEVLVTEKRLMLVEEIHLRRRQHTEAFAEPVTLRRQRAHIARTDVTRSGVTAAVSDGPSDSVPSPQKG